MFCDVFLLLYLWAFYSFIIQIEQSINETDRERGGDLEMGIKAWELGRHERCCTVYVSALSTKLSSSTCDVFISCLSSHFDGPLQRINW